MESSISISILANDTGRPNSGAFCECRIARHLISCSYCSMSILTIGGRWPLSQWSLCKDSARNTAPSSIVCSIRMALCVGCTSKQEQLFSAVETGSSTLLTVDMDVETSLPVPAPMVKQLLNNVLDHLAEKLKQRAEQLRTN